MPKSTKDASYSQEHVLERALERYNLQLTADDYARLNERVKSTISGGESETEILLNDENGEQIWGVAWESQTLLCVWTKEAGRVTTLLPEGTTITRRKGSGKGTVNKGRRRNPT